MPPRSPRRATRLRPPTYQPQSASAARNQASQRDAILADLAREEARFAELERSLEASRARIAQLRADLERTTVAPSPHRLAATSSVPVTPSEKVGLFRSLFRGRDDVFPIRFVSKKTGKPGYAPLCHNKWEPVCILKKGGRCSECPSQAFAPVSDEAIANHLKGHHVMGIYPLLDDDACWFLAADFDERSWTQDVAAFRETCRDLGVPVAIERSRSGNGAHAWIFFAEPVPASLARQIGSYLVTETMNRRHELSMSSYDRLFPNQDTLPRGGFGNLIALPLQGEARRQGNSVFVDEAFVPYPDQWAYMASIPRMSLGEVQALAGEGMRRGQGLGVLRADEGEAEETEAPWKTTPSRRASSPRIEGPLPPRVKGVLAQRLFIEKAGLPSPMLARLKRIAAFQNPEFYKKQQMRFSTATIPRVISCAEDLERFIALPRGCVTEVQRLLGDHDIELVIDDERNEGIPARFEFHGELSPLQRDAASALLAHDDGVFVGPPGVGKTVLGTYLIHRRARNTLVLVHRKPLLEQWVAQLAIFLGIDEKDVGQVGGGKRKPNAKLDVAMIQSLVRGGEVDDLVADYGHVIVDECHHLPAVSFERVLAEVKARYVVGLTATPQRRDGHQPITEMQLGPVRYRVDAKSQAARRAFEHKLIVRETSFAWRGEGSETSIQDIYRALAGDEKRNQQIVDDVVALIEEGRSPILLTERKDHLESLAERLRRLVRHVIVLQGGMSAKERRNAVADLAAIPESAERVVLATGRYVGEGFDDPRLDTLLLAMPVSWKGTLVQYSGRLHRRHPDKTEVRIYDYVDQRVPMLLRMFEKRLATYRAIGYARGEAPLGFAEPSEERTVEYDEEARRHFASDVAFETE